MFNGRCGRAGMLAVVFVVSGFIWAERPAYAAATTASARSSERIGEDVVFLASESARALAPQSSRCAEPENLIPKAFGKDDPLPGTQKVMACLYLDQFAASSKPLTFTSSDPQNPCSVKWKNGVPLWADPAQRKIMAAHGTAKKVLKSRKQMFAEGYKVRTAEQRRSYLAGIEQIRDQMAPSCCGEDRACLGAMKQLRIAQCSAEGDRDPNKPDSCTYANGYFDLSAEEKATFRDSLVGNPLKAILPGGIVLSPYLDRNGNAVALEATIRHELGHACTSIRRQATILKGGLNAFRSSESLDAQINGACDLGDTNKVAYADILSASSGASAARVFDCVRVLSEKSSDSKSTAFFEESCEASKLEEGMAEAIALSETEPLVPKGFPDRICYGLPSTRHMASADVFACLIRNNPKFRARLSAELSCEGSAR